LRDKIVGRRKSEDGRKNPFKIFERIFCWFCWRISIWLFSRFTPDFV
jgi:hypothetical protein